MTAFDVPANIEESDINSNLNSVVLLIFLTGIYTAIYFGTIYIYFTRNSSKYHIVPAAITMLYMSGIAGTAVQWYSTKVQLVNNGETRQSVFLATFGGPPWVVIALNLTNCVSFVIADGLLIWRCFYVWNRSLRIISVSLFLIIAETVLFLVQISFNARYNNLTISRALAVRLNAELAAAYFMSFSTTLVTTVLIAYRIFSVSKHEGASFKRFKHIIDIIVQSGAVYALSQLTTAIAGVVPGLTTSNTGKIAFIDYGPLINFAIAGITPTIMVSRVALLSPDTTYPSASVHLSGLQFHARSTHPTLNIEAIEAAQSVDRDGSLVGKEQAMEVKVQ